MHNGEFWFDRFIFLTLEAAERFRLEIRKMGFSSTISSPSGCSYSYGVIVFDRTGKILRDWPLQTNT
jgi:hypothetical protein